MLHQNDHVKFFGFDPKFLQVMIENVLTPLEIAASTTLVSNEWLNSVMGHEKSKLSPC